MTKLNELLQKRSKLVADARVITDKALAETRSMTAEESAAYDKIFAEINAVDETRARVEKQIELDRTIAATTAAAAEQSRGGNDTPELKQFRKWLAGEQRGLQADLDAGGGFWKAPKTFSTDLIKAIDNLVFIRSKGKVIPVTSGDSLGAPELAADVEDLTWTAEIGTADEDTAMSAGGRELKPHQLTKRIKVSRKLMRIAAMPIEQLVMERLAYKNAITQENAFLNGSGAGQPLGLFTASSQGVSTSRDYSTGNEQTAVTFDGLIGAKYSVKGQYMGKAEWIFHRDAVSQIAKLKDGEGQYLWQPSKALGEPDLLLGRPVNISEYAPNTFTSGLYVGLFGDLSQYWIADSLNLEMQRLDELYAETNQVGFIARSETDGAPVLGEAFARVKLA